MRTGCELRNNINIRKGNSTWNNIRDRYYRISFSSMSYLLLLSHFFHGIFIKSGTTYYLIFYYYYPGLF